MSDVKALKLLGCSREGPSSPQHTGCDYGLKQLGSSVRVDPRVKKEGRVGPEGSPGLGDACI